MHFKNLSKKILILNFLSITAFAISTMTSCSSNEPEMNSEYIPTSSPLEISKPKYIEDLTTSSSNVSIKVKFNTGGDIDSKVNATIHYITYNARPNSNPKKSDLLSTGVMQQYSVKYYHDNDSNEKYGNNNESFKGITESIIFEYSSFLCLPTENTYIYYYVECCNSEGSVETPIFYTINRPATWINI